MPMDWIFIMNMFNDKHNFMRFFFCSNFWLGGGIQFYQSVEILVLN